MSTLHSESPSVTQLVARNVRDALKRQRWSGRSAAIELGWGTAFISRRLSGDVDFNVSELSQIADLLNVPVGSFFDEDGRGVRVAGLGNGRRGPVLTTRRSAGWRPEQDSNLQPTDYKAVVPSGSLSPFAARKRALGRPPVRSDARRPNHSRR
jgi:transcriptional regulator with XRE-family HTH domain